MRLLVYSAPTPTEDLALEEAIQTAIEAGSSPNTWRLWQAAAPAVVLGTGQEAAKEVDLDVARGDGVAVLRRHSGGGAVVVGPGVINYSAFYVFSDLPGSETIRGATTAALRPIIELLARWHVCASMLGLSDLTVQCADGVVRKIAGNAQARKRRSVLVHGTLLANPDWDRIVRLLRHPSAEPDYRAGRDHRGFLTSLRAQGAPHELPAFADGLAATLASVSRRDAAPTADEQERAARLLAEKYANPEWNLRR